MNVSCCHRVLSTLLLGITSLGLSVAAIAQDSTPSAEHMDYWSVWADATGKTHQSLCRLTDMTLESFAPPAAPEWVSHGDPQAKRLVFNVTPVGWVGSWHRNPSKQWVIPLEGRWFTETSDGVRRVYGPGEIMLGGDQSARSVNGKEGHLSGTVGNTPTRIFVIQLDPSTLKQPDAPCAAGGDIIDGARP